MNLMKKSLFGLLAAAAALPASAAVVNYSWTGAAGYVVSGQIDTGAATGAVTEADIVSATMSIVNPSAATIYNGAGSFTALSFNTTTLGAGASGSVSLEGDDTGNSGSYWLLAGDVNVNNWSLSDLFAVAADNDASGAQNLTLTAVPEPEMVAAVAGLGLVAFGLARRKFVKA